MDTESYRERRYTFYPSILSFCLICHRDCECGQLTKIFLSSKQIHKCISFSEICGTLEKQKHPKTLMDADASTANVGIKCLLFIILII